MGSVAVIGDHILDAVPGGGFPFAVQGHAQGGLLPRGELLLGGQPPGDVLDLDLHNQAQGQRQAAQVKAALEAENGRVRRQAVFSAAGVFRTGPGRGHAYPDYAR